MTLIAHLGGMRRLPALAPMHLFNVVALGLGITACSSPPEPVAISLVDRFAEATVEGTAESQEEPLRTETEIQAKVRYRDPRVPARFIPDGTGGCLLRFEDPQRALASGQICALYDGERVLGGGVYL